jgi:hypothetical protein
MALMKPGPIVQAISGTVAGTNFVNATRSVYIRNSKPAKSATSETQLARQGSMTRIVRAWNALTTAQRTAWTVAAKQLSWHNRLGVPIKLSGREFFFQRNLFNLGPFFGSLVLAIETAPPTMEISESFTGLILTNPDAATLNLQHLHSMPPPLPFEMFWISRSFSGAPRRTWSHWTPFLGNGFFISTTNILPYLVGTPGLPGQTANPAVGRPRVGERIAVMGILRWQSYLNSNPVVAEIVMAF